VDVASRLPLILGSMSLLLSLVLAVWTLTSVSLSPLFPGVTLPLANPSTVPLSIAGYVLTPITTIAAMAWDRVGQRRGLRNRNFVLRPRYSFILRIEVWVGFALGIWHILNIANAMAGSR